jgi:hypothetical protein
MSESIGGNSPHDNYNGVQPVTVETILLDPSLFLEQDQWFQLLQDDGKEMTTEEYAIYQEPPTGRPKKKYKTIAYNGFFLSRTLFISQQNPGAVGEEAPELFYETPKFNKKYVSHHSHHW